MFEVLFYMLNKGMKFIESALNRDGEAVFTRAARGLMSLIPTPLVFQVLGLWKPNHVLCRGLKT